MQRQEPWPAEYYKGQCGRGHPRSPDNTRLRRQNGVIKADCRICRAMRESELSKRKRDHRAEYLRTQKRKRREEAGTDRLDWVEVERARGRKVFPDSTPRAEAWRPTTWRTRADEDA